MERRVVAKERLWEDVSRKQHALFLINKRRIEVAV
jgi:hypothetical protein